VLPDAPRVFSVLQRLGLARQVWVRVWFTWFPQPRLFKIDFGDLVLGSWIHLVFKAWFIHQRVVDEDEGLDRDEDLECG
jgi:hypothetical protein